MANKIRPNLWFDKEAEEAAAFYCSIFKDSEITNVTRFAEAAPGEPGTGVLVIFRLGETEFVAINGGPMFKFTEAVSFEIECHSQEEVDYYWNRLTEGGEESQCGWLKDKYGLSWQVTPKRLVELIQDPDPERAGRAIQAMLQMQKIDIATIEAAADGELTSAAGE
jgi:predicted 3-demethylubiquinone-9 3-methyltransferase (glyoxalase superfamily)